MCARFRLGRYIANLLAESGERQPLPALVFRATQLSRWVRYVSPSAILNRHDCTSFGYGALWLRRATMFIAMSGLG